MKQYKKPLMKIVELEKVDVLTCSQGCQGVESNTCEHEHHTDCELGVCYTE